MEFKDLIFKPHNSVRSEMYESLGFSDNQFHSKYTFDNGVSISILKGDMFDVDSDTSIHNQNKLKEWHDILQTDEFYESIIDDLL